MDAEHSHRGDDAPTLEPIVGRDLEGLDARVEVALREGEDALLDDGVGDHPAQDDGAAALVDRLAQGRVRDDSPRTVVDEHGAAGLPGDVVAEGEDVVDGRRWRCQWRRVLRHAAPRGGHSGASVRCRPVKEDPVD